MRGCMMGCLRIAAVMFGLALNPALAQDSAYAGERGRDIKALSAQEQADLLAGRGMGLARAGELNHYPGPAHVLELRDRLSLSQRQIAEVEGSFARMGAAARPLGAALVEQERALDAAFREAAITPDILSRHVAAVAQLQGRLRTVHLAAHLEMRGVLTAAQIGEYDRARGYTDAAPSKPAAHGGRHPG